MNRALIAVIAFTLVAAACGDTDEVAEATLSSEAATTSEATDDTTTVITDDTTATAIEDPGPEEAGDASTFLVEVWADNWFALYANGEMVLQDSVPITTERSFNSETLEFTATYPLTVAIEAKDFKENDSGLEYIGTDRQQMGDGGIIAQITDLENGRVVLVTDSSWSSLVIHRAPLNKECENTSDDSTCESEISDAPTGWTDAEFDASAWVSATVWSEAEVGPKDGYDEISWDSSAQLIWGTDLETDNTVLLRATAG